MCCRQKILMILVNLFSKKNSVAGCLTMALISFYYNKSIKEREINNYWNVIMNVKKTTIKCKVINSREEVFSISF